MFCKYCGKELRDGATYCSYCGRSQGEKTPDPARDGDKRDGDKKEDSTAQQSAAGPSPKNGFHPSSVFLVILIVAIAAAVLIIFFGVRSYRSHHNDLIVQEQAAEMPQLSSDNIAKARFVVNEVDKCLKGEDYPYNVVSAIQSVYDGIQITSQDDRNTVIRFKQDIADLISELEKEEAFHILSSANKEKVQEARDDIVELAGLMFDEEYYW